MSYVMVRCHNCGAWMVAPWSGFKQRRVHYCEKPHCQTIYRDWQAQQRIIIHNRFQAHHKMIRTITCLCCGKIMGLSRQHCAVQYPYCPDARCQEARVIAAKARNQAASKFYRQIGSKKSFKKQTPAAKKRECLICGKTVEDDGYYCLRCRKRIRAKAQHFNEDFLFCDTSGDDLEALFGDIIED